MQQSTASVDETRVDYILAAVDSARRAFPCRVTQRKAGSQAGSDPKVAVNGSSVTNPANGHSDKWTEESIADVNGFVEDKVT